MFRQAIRCVLVLVVGLAAWAIQARADTISLTLDPANGALTGSAGSTVGWGFTVTNTTGDWLFITASDFCLGAVNSPCTPNAIGTYTDFAGAFQFLVIGPDPESPSLTEAFDPALFIGLGSFALDPAATGSISGAIAVTYDLYNVDPNSMDFDPDADLVSAGNLLLVPASVTVKDSTVTTPEPGEWALLLAGFAVLLPLTRKLRA
jgi:hypothetical protein